MKKPIIMFALSLSLGVWALPSKAQWSVGVEGGFNRNYLQTTTGYRAFTRYEDVNGFSVGIPVQYQVNSWLAVQAAPGLIQKNSRMERTVFFKGIEQDQKNSYIQLPLMAQFSFGGKKLRGFLNLGGYAAYWAGSRIKGTVANAFSNLPDVPENQQLRSYLDLNEPYHYSEKYEFDSRRDRRMEFGLLSGIGVSYLLQNRFNFFVEGRYYRSLQDQQKNYMINQVPRYNDTYVLQAGCLFRLPKKNANVK